MNRTLAVMQMQMEMRSRLVVKQDDAQQIAAQTQTRAQQQREQQQAQCRQGQQRRQLDMAAVAPSTHRNSGFDGIKTFRTFNLTYFCV